MNLLDTFSKDGFYCTQSYGSNPEYYSQFGLLFHEGVDFGHTNKTVPVRCVNGGQCLTAYATSYGRYVIVIDYTQHCATYYCHLSSASIVSGQEVKAGDVIGNMGTTGSSTGPHCHFNFVIVDNNGNRLYKTKEQNMGYLDPLHPLDKTTAKTFPGVEEYNIDWKEGDVMNDDEMVIKKSVFEELVGKATVRDQYVALAYGTPAEVKSLIEGLSRSINEKNDLISIAEKKFDDLQREHKNLLSDICAEDALNCTQDYSTIKAEARKTGKYKTDAEDIDRAFASYKETSEKAHGELEVEIARLKALLANEGLLSDYKLEELLKEILQRLLNIVKRR